MVSSANSSALLFSLFLYWASILTSIAYGDMNLFCTCGPVEPVDDAEDGITGASAPMPT